MPMIVNPALCPFPLSAELVAILNEELAKPYLPSQTGIVLNFHDPGYTVKTGGFHPVEILVSSRGRIEYVTSFAYVGTGPFTELAKEIDFDFSLGLFQHFGREFPLEQGRELFALWQENFVAYYRMGVYSVTAEPA